MARPGHCRPARKSRFEVHLVIKKLFNCLVAPFLVLAAMLALPLAPPASAQSSSVVERLSPDTVLYMRWSGLSSLTAAQKTNHLLQLYIDPDFAPVREALAKSLQSGMRKKDARGPAIESADLISFLDNSAVVGILARPPADKEGQPPDLQKLFSFFIVYDTAGKETLLKKVHEAMAANAAPGSTLSTYSFSGTAIEVRTSGKDVSYSAQIPGRYVMASQKETVEDLITRLTAPGLPTSALTSTAEYKAARPYIAADDAFELFARVPNYEQWAPAAQRNNPAAHFFHDLHPEKIHVLAFGANFSGETTRVRAAVLGDTSAGTLFDIAGASAATFKTLPAVDAGPSFSISRIEYGAAYKLVRAAIDDSLTPQQQQAVTMYETMARSFLGMPVEDAVALFNGETASRSTVADDGAIQQTYVITIHQQADILRVLRAAAGSKIVAEDSSGTTSYLDLAFPYKDPVSGTQRRKFYYLAVTPELLVAAPRKAIAREAIASFNAAPGAAPKGVSENPEWVKLRARLPEKLSGISGSDLVAIPWDKVIANYIQQLNAGSQSAGQPPAAAPAWLLSFKPETVTRHIHVSASGWWKDSNGAYLDSYIQ
ncbi:MAG: hypothetical protein WCD27_00025 [Candidatus Acidiferrales bacterium]